VTKALSRVQQIWKLDTPKYQNILHGASQIITSVNNDTHFSITISQHLNRHFTIDHPAKNLVLEKDSKIAGQLLPFNKWKKLFQDNVLEYLVYLDSLI